MANLIIGGFWREGSLLTQELLFRHVLGGVPDYARYLLSASSQLWLLYTTYRSALEVITPLVTYLNEYRQATSGRWVRGVMPIAVNDAELSFKFFVQAVFPKQFMDPVAIQLDRVPRISNIPSLSRQYPHANPWGHLHREMEASAISRIQLGGTHEGALELRFIDKSGRQGEQVITSPLDNLYQPVPWLFEALRQKVPREDIKLYASILSQDALELAGQMLSCRREFPRLQNGEEGRCLSGYLEATDSGLNYTPRIPVILPQVWEDRNYATGRVFPLSGCNFNSKALCWENYLILGDPAFYAWQLPMTLYTRFASFAERNKAILLHQEPQIWYSGSYFQVRVPELVSRFFLGVTSIVGQVMVNRMVVSMHHKWWGNGDVAVKKAKPIPARQILEDHNESSDEVCTACGEDAPCRYPLCNLPHCSRHKPESIVNLGCHKICTDCFFRYEPVKQLQCPDCGRVHWNEISARNYLLRATESSSKVSVPRCPMCRDLMDFRNGNLKDFLGPDCKRRPLSWWFTDGFGVKTAENTAIESTAKAAVE
ncbi:hypothetical protein [Sansalvadorimonas verongulae]|uniref:hypothetical protein n=1 Tax=Sansalvadorimonas verongulae TaxID=2172824 RepID=UPI0018AD273E|nr:hypothetical protein [Sansalvadorimonas verongulae]MTI13560.1 hypothetical protein [Sansalvadorimonas verongulae]